MNRFVVDNRVSAYVLESYLNQRANEGLYLADIQCAKEMTTHSGSGDTRDALYYTLVWYRPTEGMSVPVGFKVL